MFGFEPLCLSTQTAISLRLKLKQELNAPLAAQVGLRAPAFEHSNRDFFEAQSSWGIRVPRTICTLVLLRILVVLEDVFTE
jgi:hypothetical protein